jgi:HSP20 family molecular chaperone IbpA|eukprot:36119_1
MKIIYTFPVLLVTAESFSMITPRFADFPRRFGKYLKEFDEVFEPDWPSTFMEKQLAEFKNEMESTMTFHRASPRYEVTEKPDMFEVTVDVPGFKSEEIEVGLKGGGRILTISGMHEEKDKKHSLSSKFQQNFSLDPSIQTDKMVADLEGSTLTVTAPRIDRLPERRSIPIQKIEGSQEEHHEKVAEGGKKAEAVEGMKGETVKP